MAQVKPCLIVFSVLNAATDGNDYNGISMNLVFPASSNSDTPPMCVNISIIDDASTVEPDETFTVTLSTSSSVVSLGNNMTIITITNAVKDAVEATVAHFNISAAIGGAIAVFVVLVIFIFIIVAIVCVKYRSSRMQKKGKADLLQSYRESNN